MTDDILLNKCATVERCLKRIEEEYKGAEHELANNFTKQDAIILNLQRACEASIDLANHLVRIHRLGIPQNSRESFNLLEKSEIINPEDAARMRAMVVFRNIAIHDYAELNLDIVRNILEKHLGDFLAFTEGVLKDGSG